MRLVERIGSRIVVALAVAILLGLLRASGALGAVEVPASCNVTHSPGTTITCDVAVRGPAITVQARWTGATPSTAYSVAVQPLDSDGLRTPPTDLVRATSAQSAAYPSAATSSTCGSDVCFIGSFETHHLGAVQVRLTQTGAGVAATAKVWVYMEDAPAGGAGGEVEVTNFPASFNVGNFPATQDVACVAGCAGGGGGGGEVSIDPAANTVALSSSDRERLDLAWWGTWAMVGLAFVLIAAPRWFNAFRVTRGA